MEPTSVSVLVTQLCEAMVRQCPSPGPSPTPEHAQKLVRMLRSQSFGTLLRRTPTASEIYDDGLGEMDATSRLVARSLVLNRRQQHVLASRMQDCVDSLLDKKLHEDPTFGAVLRVLVHLVDEGPELREEPKLFNLTRPMVHHGPGPVPYADFHPTMFEPPAWMMDLEVPHTSDTRMLLSPVGGFPFDKEPGTDLPLLGRFLRSADSGRSNGCMPYTIPVVMELAEPRELRIPKFSLNPDQEDEGYVTPSKDCSPVRWQPSDSFSHADSVWEMVLSVHLPRRRTWESLGQLKPVPEPPFLGEASPDSVHQLWRVRQWRLLAGPSDMCVVSRCDLVRHIKYLLVGIMSTTFHYQEDRDNFVLAPGVCVDGVTPEALQELSIDFLICGKFYRRLKAMAIPEPTTDHLAYQGLIFQALCESVRRYLHFYFGAILLLPNGPLLDLHRRIQGLKHQLLALARLCKVDGSGQLPGGIALVSYLYQQIGVETRHHVACILYSALHACSQVYFRFLQKWMFEGVSHDVYEEFFIQVKPLHTTARSRIYWSSGFVLEESAVPGFLRSLANDVFKCGKAINLLKLCNPRDPLCVALEAGYPSMPCCLRRSELRRLMRECAAFEQRARLLCGEPVTTARMYRRSEAQKRAFEETVRQAQEQRLLQLKLEREANLRQQMQQKQQQLVNLREQMQLVAARKEEERERQLKEDASMEQENQRRETEEVKRREEEKQRLIQYYAELSEAAEQHKRRVEWRTERLRLHDRRLEMLLSERHTLSIEVALNRTNADNQTRTVLECIEEATTDVAERIKEVTVSSGSDSETKPTPESLAENTSNVNSDADSDINKNISLIPLDENVVVFNEDNRNHNLTESDTKCECGDSSNTLDNRKKNNVIVLERMSEADRDICKPDFLLAAVDNSKTDLQMVAQKIKAKIQTETFEINLPNRIDESDGNRNRWRMLHGDVNIITGVNRLTSIEDASPEEMSRDTSSGLSKTSSDYNLSPLTASNSFDLGKLSGSCQQGITEDMSTGETSQDISNAPSKTDSGYNLASLTASSSFDVGKVSGTCNQGVTEDAGTEEMSRHVSNGPSKTSSDYNLASLTTSNSFDLEKVSDNCNLASLASNSSLDMGKSSSCYNLASLTTSNSFELAQSKFSMNAGMTDSLLPTSTGHDFEDSSEENEGEDLLEEDDWEGDGEGELGVLLHKSVAIPLYTQARLVNEAVLKFFLVEQALLEHLASLRGFFFLLDGEFGRSLTNLLFLGLSQVHHPSQLLNAGTLNSILVRALSSSLGGGGPHGERLSFSLRLIPDRLRLSSPDVLKCLCLQYHVEWPLNVILTPDALRKYDDVFSFLLKVRRISWVLEDDFNHLKHVASGLQKPGSQFHHVQLWRHEMTLFVRAVHNYLTSTVLQASWVEFRRELQHASTLDDLYRTHVSYVKHVLFRCLLVKQSSPVQSVLFKVFSSILNFHGQLRGHTWSRSEDGLQLKHPHFEILTKVFESYQALVRFLYQFVLKLATVGYQPHLFELLEILNVNNYYQRT